MVTHPNRGRGRPATSANGEPLTRITVYVATDVLTALPPTGEARNAAINAILREKLL